MRNGILLNALWQSLFATIFIGLVLYFMSLFSSSDVLWAVGAGALSSSSFIVFGNPSTKASTPKHIIFGYLIGILTGIIIRLGIMYFSNVDSGHFAAMHSHLDAVLACVSVGLCLFCMSIFKVPHPPAAGMALVLVIDMHDYGEITIILLAALLLALVRYVLRNKLVDLVS